MGWQDKAHFSNVFKPFYRYSDRDLYMGSVRDGQLFPVESVRPSDIANANDCDYPSIFLI